MSHRLFALIMSVLLLASTTSWTVGKHYCMGRVMDVSFFSKAEDCGMDLPTTTDSPSPTWAKKHCCDDQTIYITGQNDLKLSLDNLSFEHHQIIATFFNHAIYLFDGGVSQLKVPFKYYPPPQLVKEIILWDQVFLI